MSVLPSPEGPEQQDLLDFINAWFVREADPALDPESKDSFRQHFVDWLYHHNPVRATTEYLNAVLQAARNRLNTLQHQIPATEQDRALINTQVNLLQSVLSSAPILSRERQEAIALRASPYTADELSVLPHLQQLVQQNDWNTQCRRPVRRASTNPQLRECKFSPEEAKNNPYVFFISDAGYPCCRPQDEYKAAVDYLRELIQRRDRQRLVQTELVQLVRDLTGVEPSESKIADLQQMALRALELDAKQQVEAKNQLNDIPTETRLAEKYYDLVQGRLERKTGQRAVRVLEGKLSSTPRSYKVGILATTAGRPTLQLRGAVAQLHPDQRVIDVVLLSYAEGLPLEPLTRLRFQREGDSERFSLLVPSGQQRWQLLLDFSDSVRASIPPVPPAAGPAVELQAQPQVQLQAQQQQPRKRKRSNSQSDEAAGSGSGSGSGSASGYFYWW